MKNKYVNGFDLRLRQAIRDKGMSNNQVAVLLGISWNSMNGYLNEKKMPCCLHLVKLAKLLNVSTDYLLGLKGELHERNNSPHRRADGALQKGWINR